MTKWYISSSGSDASGNGSISSPYYTYSKVRSVWAGPGDSALYRRGDVFTEQMLEGFFSGTASQPITIDAYGSGPPPVLLSGFVWFQSAGNGTIVRNLQVRPKKGQNGLELQPDGTTGSSQTIIEFCEIFGELSDSFGIYIVPSRSQQNSMANWQLRNNIIHNTGAAGIGIVGRSTGMRIANNLVEGACVTQQNSGIGMYTYQHTGGLTWSLSAGNVYQATVPNDGGTPVDYINTMILHFGADSFNYNLIDQGNTTTPTAFGYGYNPATHIVYANLNGIDVTTNNSHTYNVGKMTDWLIEGNTVRGTHRQPGVPDGSGIILDNTSGRGTVRGNKCYDNDGPGLLLQGGFMTVSGNICINNLRNNYDLAGSGIVVNNANGCHVYNNTIDQSGTPVQRASLAVNGVMDPATIDVKNNLLIAPQYAHDLQSGAASTWDAKNNDCWGYSVAENRSHAQTNGLNVDPQLNSSYVPGNAALKATGASILVPASYFGGKEIGPTPDIGAIPMISARSIDSARRTTIRAPA